MFNMVLGCDSSESFPRGGLWGSLVMQEQNWLLCNYISSLEPPFSRNWNSILLSKCHICSL